MNENPKLVVEIINQFISFANDVESHVYSRYKDCFKANTVFINSKNRDDRP